MKHLKRRLTILAIALLFLVNVSHAQETIFAYVDGGESSRFAPEPITGYKLEVTKKVYTDLVRARGDMQKKKPTLLMNKGRRYIAWMNPEKVQIGVEEKAYDICRGFGKDSLKALAMLLSHELTHYYESHDWSRHFVNANEGLETSEKIGALDEGIKLEAQADYLGGILAISAGYDGYGLMPEFLKETYARYGLPDELPGYPSLQERIRLSENTAKELKILHGVYKTANFLTLINAYEPAIDYYEYILTKYQSTEVYNNAGVSAALALLELIDPEEMPYVLPLELDQSSRLDELATRLPKDLEERKSLFLEKSRQFLANAIGLSKKEATPMLNMAILAMLEDEWDESEYLARKAIKTAKKYKQPKAEGDALIVLGILAALQGDKSEAEDFFQRGQKQSPNLANRNLALLSDRPKETASRQAPTKGVEKIGSIYLDDFLADPQVDQSVELGGNVFNGQKTYESSTVELHFADDGDKYAIFQETSPDYAGQSQLGAKEGDSREKVENLYGPASKIINLREGICLRYDNAKILFFFNAKDQLDRWVIFNTEL